MVFRLAFSRTWYRGSNVLILNREVPVQALPLRGFYDRAYLSQGEAGCIFEGELSHQLVPQFVTNRHRATCIVSRKKGKSSTHKKIKPVSDRRD